MPATILQITIFDNPDIEKHYSKAAWATQMAQSALLDFGRGYGATAKWGDIIIGDGVSAGRWQWTPGPDEPT
jgi:hypothetical protein